jgi:hypothetical protein
LNKCATYQRRRAASAWRKWINWRVRFGAEACYCPNLGEGSDSECVAMLLSEEARNCRVQAERFAGKAEAPFLLHLAEAFEELAVKEQPRRRSAERHRRPTGF